MTLQWMMMMMITIDPPCWKILFSSYCWWGGFVIRTVSVGLVASIQLELSSIVLGAGARGHNDKRKRVERMQHKTLRCDVTAMKHSHTGYDKKIHPFSVASRNSNYEYFIISHDVVCYNISFNFPGVRKQVMNRLLCTTVG